MNRVAAFVFTFCLAIWAQETSDNVNLTGVYYEETTRMYKDIFGYVDEEWREYALLTQTHGLHIIEVTDPANPRKIVFIPAPESNWKDVKTYSHYAYLGADATGQGIQIIDLSTLPDTAMVIDVYTENGMSSTHNIWIDTTNALMYATENAAIGCRIVSLEDPENPVQISSFNEECHDFHTADTRPGLLFVPAGRSDEWYVYDVSDPTDPQRTHTVPIPGGDTYVHNAWTTKDGNYLVTTEEQVEKTVKMWDIRDLDNIFMVDEYLANPGPQSIAHNAYIRGDTMYVSHYGQGLRILDISDPTNMVEIGYIQPDYPASPDELFGSWGAYVFFPSGNIISSHVRLGMFDLAVEGVTNIEGPVQGFGVKDPSSPSLRISGWKPVVGIENIRNIKGRRILGD